ncbi:site-specific DNA-methyltransferase [Helicobacter pylori]|uniref:site-specific DNA-methyltransferase (adenine-specific) n=1 Tax=Helicobacter pylori HP260AFii TaxID=1159077 RepID=A0ABC9S860_HELPX|nr:site-specific DNA-methyltransferase [Helicobacter pylori]EMH17908.1 DNA (cytosine-5-)-methyltransferase [Helicobacter pylori GAM260ASi]EMH30114.1 DNA (cytosine-5-)-methyltransferase [Helicobacter pylori GAM268Bii]EMH63846.1 DNA (cytosine-5-)-methyltransferase [Helicobacter pylori HP260AFi]EMH65067.1 DNA (cytosine-5-)-methyltransferase [Helicobacter pylori HP260AFii]EMH67267.1 DNA (cytosine-5-)-methyltransferase [Helicobacter pylori HP260ASii]
MLKTPLKTLLDILINHFTKERLVTLILTADEKLLTFMLEHENANDYKNAFFKTIANSLVFNQEALLECLEIKELEKSFTRFKNKIGLFSQGGFLKSSGSVVLNFPFKDNVLLGNAKDNNTKSNELFYHEILHKNEIDVLLSPKVLCRFEMHGQGDLKNALKDENTNYLIKGNNLIALHSLKKKFAKKVKCIYIDPPYNTGNDSFNYNDNFNHSSWLVFMKNRLEAAREFLSDDGSIYINLDYNEVHYCKVLMDEIFKRENFRSEIIWRMGFLSGYKTAAKKYIRNHDTILFYSKSDNYLFNKTYIENKDFLPLLTKNEVQNAFKKFSFPQEKIDDFLTFINHENRGEKYPLEDTWNSNKWDKLNSIAIDSSVSRVDETIAIDDENFKGQKPESLIQRILEVSTNENDLVLDFFAGSGTTCAVAHKMKRRYIGIEQMDYIETITKERLKKVIEGEQGGISKKCDFKGGGSFVYAELKEVNLGIKKQILNAKSTDECLKIFNDLNARVLKRADNKMDGIHSEEFQNLDLNEQKRKCCASLDSNEDYLNLGDIDEDAWEIDEITKKYNEIFYS